MKNKEQQLKDDLANLQEQIGKQYEHLAKDSDLIQKYATKMQELYHYEENKNKILNLLRELKNADDLIPKIFLNGSCFRLYKILKVIEPTAEAYYSHKEGHWITKINGQYYDINGILNLKYVEDQAYSQDNGVGESAYIHTYSNNLATPYTKYLKTI